MDRWLPAIRAALRSLRRLKKIPVSNQAVQGRQSEGRNRHRFDDRRTPDIRTVGWLKEVSTRLPCKCPPCVRQVAAYITPQGGDSTRHRSARRRRIKPPAVHRAVGGHSHPWTLVPTPSPPTRGIVGGRLVTLSRRAIDRGQHVLGRAVPSARPWISGAEGIGGTPRR